MKTPEKKESADAKVADRPADKQNKFKDTLNLPHTDFPIRPQSAVEDPLVLKEWEKENLYKKTFEKNHGKEKFILHDGPPYANGHLHLGHAFNDILKDVITKYKRMIGFHVPFTPGWDCHGLPIEHKVSKEYPNLSRKELIKKCRETAEYWINVQREECKNTGVLMDFDNPYKTMDFVYESEIIKAFGMLVKNSYIQRKKKTVPWCPSCQTVLATAEIEYVDKKDHSLYVLFPLEEQSAQKLLKTDKKISLLIWTTTPWTLPLNQAIVAKPDFLYDLLEINDQYVIVGSSRSDFICDLLKVSKKVITTINSQKFYHEKIFVINPLFSMKVPIILDNSVEITGGTAFVHCAPGAGPEDYEIGIKNNLLVYSPIGENGRFIKPCPIEELIGKNISEGSKYILEQLKNNGNLFYLGSITHSFPHCWRSQTPLIFRATTQWFCDLSHNDLKERAIEAIQNLHMIPDASKNRFLSTIEGRLEWCLSRQRVWGTPIPALICNECDFAFISFDFINNIAKFVKNEGIEFWSAVDIDAIPESKNPCPQCNTINWKKELDILDVWFDSGVSAWIVLKQNPELQYPADIYVEGKDQHRGWFQSSLLLSLALSESHNACMKSILTHGFTVDEHGHKMSKSRGNVVSPQEMIDKLSRDGLRLWVSSVNYADDAVVSEKVFTAISESFRKIRNTCRFLLANINDFNYQQDSIPFSELSLLDQYALQELFTNYYTMIFAYENYDFSRVFRTATDYCVISLSALYLDIIKDRLYVEKKDGIKRRSAQTVCYIILDTLTKIMAPIMSFTMEKINQQYQKNNVSIHEQTMPILSKILLLFGVSDKKIQENTLVKDCLDTLKELFSKKIEHRQWDFIKQLRSEILKIIEPEREKGIIKHSLEAAITLSINKIAMDIEQKTLLDDFQNNFKTTEEQEQFFKELLIVSGVTLVENQLLESTEIKGIYVKVERAKGMKCPRCWHYTESKDVDDLCDRCVEIVKL